MSQSYFTVLLVTDADAPWQEARIAVEGAASLKSRQLVVQMLYGTHTSSRNSSASSCFKIKSSMCKSKKYFV